MDLYKILDTLKVLEESAMQGFRDDGRKAAINKKPNENPFTKPGEEEMAKSWQAGYDSVTKPKTKNEGQRYPDTSTSLADREAVVPNIKDYDDKKINWDQTTRARKVEPTITPKTVTKKPMSPFGSNLKEEQLDELKCWPGYSRVPGTKEGTPGSCKRKTSEDNTMMSAAKKPTGPKFVGKMKGTDPASSRYNKLVGCEESVQEQIGREWAEYLNEFAPTQPGSQKTNNPVQQKAEADKEKGVKNLIQKTNTGTGAGINPGAAKDLVAAIDSPTANPKTGANMTQQAKSALNAIGAQHVQAASKNNMTATQKDVANLQNALGQK